MVNPVFATLNTHSILTNGTNQWLGRASETELEYTRSENRTFSCWFKANDVIGVQGICGNWGSASAEQHWLMQNTAAPQEKPGRPALHRAPPKHKGGG